MNALASRNSSSPSEPAPAPAPPSSALAHVLTGLPELAKGLLAAIRHVKSVPKESRNPHHQYNYAAADAIIAEAREALLAGGCVLLPLTASINGSEREGPDRFELARTFALVHESGQAAPVSVVWPIVTDRGRPLDKAAGAADTLSLAYLLRDLLQMDRVDPSDDVAGRDDTRQAAPVPAAAPKKKPLPADGTEAEARIRKRDHAGALARRWAPGELVAWVTNQAVLTGAPAEMVRWGPETIRLLPDWVRTYEASHPPPSAPPPPAGESARQRDTPPQKVTTAQKLELIALIERKGRKWEFCRQVFGWPANHQPADLTPQQYAQLTQALNEEPDAEPARK